MDAVAFYFITHPEDEENDKEMPNKEQNVNHKFQCNVL